jgi:hypothetical protein
MGYNWGFLCRPWRITYKTRDDLKNEGASDEPTGQLRRDGGGDTAVGQGDSIKPRILRP